MADVCYFIGEEQSARSYLRRDLPLPLPEGYAYDCINRDALLTRATAKNGCLVLPDGVGYPPSSNHYGAMMAAATGILAILGDPGTDTARLEKVLAEFEGQIPEALTCGFGDHGFYSEGHHPGRIFSNLGLVPMLRALRNVTGRDYIAARPNAQWITLHWILSKKKWTLDVNAGSERFSF